MAGFINLIGMKLSRKGVCNKCGQPRDVGSHAKCDRWPTQYGSGKGFHYVSNSQESTILDLQDIVAAICEGEDPRTPVRFELRIMQTALAPESAALTEDAPTK